MHGQPVRGLVDGPTLFLIDLSNRFDSSVMAPLSAKWERDEYIPLVTEAYGITLCAVGLYGIGVGIADGGFR